MTHAIIRIYDNDVQASKAAEHLRNEGYEHVHQFKGLTGKASSNATSRTNLVKDMMAASIWKGDAETYADRLTKGKSLVLVHAHFGTGRWATTLLDSYEPSETGVPHPDHHSDFKWDDAAPLSSMLRLPVLSRTKLPMEAVSGISSLTKGSGFLSDFFGIPLLKEGLENRSSSMGLPLLSNSATPLSSLFGLRTLSQSATPLSSLFGLPTLTKRK